MTSRPNLVLIMTDDHAAHACSAYGSRINQTPQLDRIATGGMRMDTVFCTNAICAPSRASILTGTYSHRNGVPTLMTDFDYRLPTFPQVLQRGGYATALFGKWHLGDNPENLPQGFDDWRILPGQGAYHDPVMLRAGGPGGEAIREKQLGYVTDVITDLSIDWLRARNTERPFCLLVHHKAPHRPWLPDEAHADLYDGVDIPEPETLFDDYATRSEAARAARMRISDDLRASDVKAEVPPELAGEEQTAERTKWNYQRYIKDYLRCVASVDDNVGRLLDHLDEAGLAEDTIVVYTSDQGFFLGDHGWYDKRFIYEQSLRMPMLVRWPGVITPGSTSDALVTNVDFAQTFLDAAGVDAAAELPDSQGRSFRDVLAGSEPDDWPKSMYYRYWEHDSKPHHVWGHYGVRTGTHKLVYFYNADAGAPGSTDLVAEPEWEMYDLIADPAELHNVANDPAYADTRAQLEAELARLQAQVGDQPYPADDSNDAALGHAPSADSAGQTGEGVRQR